ncbi:hypothetical protein B566_EDAN017528 [Ephemera danica]|nr:hypothetical protein B566_EDAN017528 [Ephemera danica]
MFVWENEAYTVPLLLALLAASALAQQQPTRRVRVRARPLAQPQPEVEERIAQEPQVQYYAVQSQEEVPEPEAVVVVQPRARPANYYGSQLARADEELRQPAARPLSRAIAQQQPRTKAHERAPPVQTIRNYNTINDDGSFTFGYESADGSFKEETRGTDCVVRGKYGYIDPDGNKREFTYVSGNPCDPNNPDPEEDERELDENDSEENVPVRPAIRRPINPRPAARPQIPQQPAQPVFQNNYLHGERIHPQARPTPGRTITIAPRPVPHVRVAEEEPTTYRPQIQNYPAVTTPRPAQRPQQHSFYTTAAHVQPTTPSSIDFDAELKKFQIESGAPLKTTPASLRAGPTVNSIQPQSFATRQPVTIPARAVTHAPRPTPAAAAGVNPYYSSQLVYDPASGQYNTVLYQNLPKGQGDFQLNHRLQSFVQPQNQYLNPAHHQAYQPTTYQTYPTQASPAAAPQYEPVPATPASSAQFGPQTFNRAPVSETAPQQSFYYINPNLRNQYSTGQIDAFLRGHNIQF